jgi:hypothetical protein
MAADQLPETDMRRIELPERRAREYVCRRSRCRLTDADPPDAVTE